MINAPDTKSTQQWVNTVNNHPLTIIIKQMLWSEVGQTSQRVKKGQNCANGSDELKKVMLTRKECALLLPTRF